MSEHRVTLGRVAGVYGIKGWIKVVSATRPAENILDYRRWWIAKGNGHEAQLLEGRVHGRGLIAQISGADGQALPDRTAAEMLVGAEIQVARSELPAPSKGQYFWTDLIGLQVCSELGDKLGVVTEVINNGAQDVLVVQDGEQERMIPFVQGAIIKSVDLTGQRIVADWLPEY
jgi:16S rRNA processing protein RimM